MQAAHVSCEQQFEEVKDAISHNMAALKVNSDELDNALENLNSNEYPESTCVKKLPKQSISCMIRYLKDSNYLNNQLIWPCRVVIRKRNA